MRIRPGVLIAVVAVLALVFGGRYLGLYGGKGADERAGGDPAPPVEEEVRPTSITVSPAPAAPTPVAAPRPVPRPAAPVVPAPVPTAPAAETPALITNWEERIDTLLTSPGDEAQKTRDFISLFPNLPPDGQVEAAQHLSNLLADEDFKLLTPLLNNPAYPEEVLDVLMTDVLNRPNELKLPALLDVARMPNHPKAEEARDILEIYVDENYAEDWVAWTAAVERWLRENPEE